MAISITRQTAHDGPDKIGANKSGAVSAVRMETSGFMLPRSLACFADTDASPQFWPCDASHNPDNVQ
jgi:hypothetical protein